MALHPLAGKPAPKSVLTDVTRLLARYAAEHPDMKDPQQRVAFGTSGHRGSSEKTSFNEDHILAIVQATCEYRTSKGINGPLFLGMDTHALSAPAHATALEILVANNVSVLHAPDLAPTPTPLVSHAILCFNKGKSTGLADGLIITPSHNPPPDGGIKYNPPNGGPADTDITQWIETRANALLTSGIREVKRASNALKSPLVRAHDFIRAYVADLPNVVDLAIMKGAKLKIGADPLGGSNVNCWDPIAEQYGLNITVVNRTVDPQFGFMTLDHDGKIRMDCSSPHAMANLVGMKDRFDVAFGNDADSDRHGIVTPAGLMNPNHYLAVAIDYLFQNRPDWRADSGVGKTLVSSGIIDRVAKGIGRRLVEVPVGFKWFVPGLLDGSLGFGGEESAGASFLRKDGTPWSTDKDGIIMDLLAVEMMARTGMDPQKKYNALEGKYGSPRYVRMDQAATPAQKSILRKLSPAQVQAETLAGEKITARLTRAAGNNADIGGLKVTTENGWFAARPSGTEDVYKIYAESFLGEEHLQRVVEEAKAIVAKALGG